MYIQKCLLKHIGRNKHYQEQIIWEEMCQIIFRIVSPFHLLKNMTIKRFSSRKIIFIPTTGKKKLSEKIVQYFHCSGNNSWNLANQTTLQYNNILFKIIFIQFMLLFWTINAYFWKYMSSKKSKIFSSKKASFLTQNLTNFHFVNNPFSESCTTLLYWLISWQNLFN